MRHGRPRATAKRAAPTASNHARATSTTQALASLPCVSADGVWQPTIASASWIKSSFSIAATMIRAKSVRRVTLLARIGSPTCRLHPSRPWFSPSSRSLPRTTVHRESLAKTRRHASTWSSRSATPASHASPPPTFTSAFRSSEYLSWPSRVMCPPHENTSRAPGCAVVKHCLGRSRRVVIYSPRHQDSEHRVTPSTARLRHLGRPWRRVRR